MGADHEYGSGDNAAIALTGIDADTPLPRRKGSDAKCSTGSGPNCRRRRRAASLTHGYKIQGMF
jgi:hypothetical protein